MTTLERAQRTKSALIVLEGGMSIWEKWGDHSHAPFRQVALREQAKALINHDRLRTGDARGSI